MIRSLVSLTMFAVITSNGAAQARPDVSGVDQFWPIAERLAADSEPAPEVWRRLLDTPAYRQLNRLWRQA